VSRLSRLSAKFWCLPLSDEQQIFSILLTIIFVRIALSCVGYNRLKKNIPPAYHAAPLDVLRKFGRLVPSLARFVPGASCLTQAVTAQLLLARRGYRSDMRVGERQDEAGKISAHAWLLAQGQIVLGDHPADLQAYAPLVDLSPRSS
jgi:hypothetical protein